MTTQPSKSETELSFPGFVWIDMVVIVPSHPTPHLEANDPRAEHMKTPEWADQTLLEPVNGDAIHFYINT